MSQKNFGMRLSASEREKIERLAEAEGKNMKEAILSAVRHRLKELETPLEAGPGSVLDGLDDLVGSAEGPEDLSLNREHLEGYGR